MSTQQEGDLILRRGDILKLTPKSTDSDLTRRLKQLYGSVYRKVVNPVNFMWGLTPVVGLHVAKPAGADKGDVSYDIKLDPDQVINKVEARVKGGVIFDSSISPWPLEVKVLKKKPKSVVRWSHGA